MIGRSARAPAPLCECSDTEAALGLDLQALWQDVRPVASLALLTGLFALVACDVILPDSFHLLQPVDTAVHTWVASNVPLQARIFADTAISDTPILLGSFGCMACLAAIASVRPKQGLTMAGLVAATNYVGTTPPFVDCLAVLTQRSRTGCLGLFWAEQHGVASHHAGR